MYISVAQFLGWSFINIRCLDVSSSVTIYIIEKIVHFGLIARCPLINEYIMCGYIHHICHIITEYLWDLYIGMFGT